MIQYHSFNFIISNFTSYLLQTVILLGEVGVGKTNLIRRYNEERYQSNVPRTVSVEIIPTKVQCLDGRQFTC